MNALIKGLATIFAVVIVGHSSGHSVSTPITHRAPLTSVGESADRVDNPLLRGRGNIAFPAPPAPAAEAPAVNSAQGPLQNQPISQLPIATQPPPPVPAPPAVVIGSTQQALINQDRAAAGQGALNWSPCLAAIAYQNAVRMANQDAISHAGGAQASLGCGLGSRTGENIGWTSNGIDDGQLNRMFMSSPGHRENIMGPFHSVGAAWTVAPNGHAYIAVEFS